MRYLAPMALIGIGIVGGWAGVMYFLHPPLDAASAAGWVQAVGSVVAIGAAIWIASRQAAADQKLRRDELIDRLGAVAEMLTTCRDTTDELHQAIIMSPAIQGRKFPSLELVNAARVSIQVVTAIAPVQAPTPTAVAALITAQTAIANGIAIIPGVTGEFHVAWTAELEKLNAALDAAATMIELEISRVKGA